MDYEADENEFDGAESSDDELIPDPCDDDEVLPAVDDEPVAEQAEEEEQPDPKTTRKRDPRSDHKALVYSMLLVMHIEEEIGIEAEILKILLRGGMPPMNIDEFLAKKMNEYTCALMCVMLGIPFIITVKNGYHIRLSDYTVESVIVSIKKKYPFCLKGGSHYQHELLLEYFPITFSMENSMEEWYPEEVDEVLAVRKRFGWSGQVGWDYNTILSYR